MTAARMLLVAGLATALSIAACEEPGASTGTSGGEYGQAEGGGDDGAGHDGGEGAGHDPDDGDRDGHELEPLGAVAVGEMQIQAFQGDGAATPGKELRLVVRLPEDDSGTSTVRGWIGTNDRYASLVALARYSAEAGGYELRTIAPDPLPDSASWWIEVELADGTAHVGSVAMK